MQKLLVKSTSNLRVMTRNIYGFVQFVLFPLSQKENYKKINR